jgi:hypothetical protein
MTPTEQIILNFTEIRRRSEIVWRATTPKMMH